jgi:hypothetical protein
MLANQEIDVIIIDNESTDNSHELYSTFWNRPIILVDHLPYKGHFSLTEQLSAKQKIYNSIDHDWVVHHDADEIIEHFARGKTLRNAIQEADESGYSVLNFDEFVFLPEVDVDYFCRNYYKEMLRYYFFEPQKSRLNRAWKRSLKPDIMFSGGHRVSGEHLSVSPVNHILRHYIVLGNAHARKKYLYRAFSDQDRSRGWHVNRLNFTKENLVLPYDSPYLFQLESYDSKEFHREKPTSKHYWEWI